MTDQEQFYSVLSNCLNTNNELRKQAEELYDKFPVEVRLPSLLQVITNAAAPLDLRQLSAVMLRKIIINDFTDYIAKLPAEQFQEFKNQIILILQQDDAPILKHKMSDAASELARNCIDEEGNNLWPEFLEFLFENAKSPNPLHKECSLQMFANVPGIFGKNQAQFLHMIGQMLCNCLQDPNHTVQVAAAKATTSFIIANEEVPSIFKQFSACLPLLLQVLLETFNKQEDDSVLKSFVELAETCPKFLKYQIDNLLQLCVKAVGQTEFLDSWRQLSLEVIVTLAESADAMVRRLGQKHIVNLLPHIFSLMTELEDDPEWSLKEDLDDDDIEDNANTGEASLDRLCCSLGGKMMLPLIVGYLQDMLNNEDWKRKHAGLMAISSIGEGCHKQMEPLLPQIVDNILRFLQDPHPRVRYACCSALGQMASDFSTVFEKKFHGKVIPGLLNLLEDVANPRVQAHAGAALVNFFEECPKKILVLYLDGIVSQLEAVFNHRFKELAENGSNHTVLEQMVVTLSALADTVEDSFSKHYEKFMPCLKFIIQNANTPQLRTLRGKTIECVSLIGLAVGKERFQADASEVMDMLLKTQTQEVALADDDPQIAYLISSWARICKILGKQFEPYLPFVMGPVLKAASIKPEVALVDENDIESLDNGSDWQFISLGESQNFGIRTSGLEDKATACSMLVCYARELKEGFVPYLEDVVKLMVPLLKFYFHDGVREAAAEIMPYLLECAKVRGDNAQTELWNYISLEIIKAIEGEPEKDILCDLMESLSHCIEVLDRSSFTEEMVISLLQILDKNIKEHFTRAQERIEKQKDEDYDELVEENLEDEKEEDSYLLSKVTDIIHSFFLIYKQDFLPFFENLLPLFVQLLNSDKSISDRQVAMCVFDDVIEYGGPLCKKYEEFFLGKMLSFCEDISPELRQASSYGIGVLAQFGGNEFAPACAEAIPKLIRVIEHQESRLEANLCATENAISAIAKIIAFNSSQILVDEMLPVWLNWLPIWEDLDEMKFVYEFVCSLIEQNNPLVLGDNNSNLPKIVNIFTQTFVKNPTVQEEEFGKRMVGLLKHIQVNWDMFNAFVAQLSEEEQIMLRNLLA